MNNSLRLTPLQRALIAVHSASIAYIAADRHLEHLSRTAKNLLRFLGHQNITDEQIELIGNIIQPMHDLCRRLDCISGIPQEATYINPYLCVVLWHIDDIYKKTVSKIFLRYSLAVFCIWIQDSEIYKVLVF